MEENRSFGFDDFSVEMQDFEVRRTRKFDRIWNVGEGGSMCCIPLIHDGIIYFGCCNHNIYAVEADTGKLVWKYKTFGIMFESSPVYWEGMIFAGSYDHNMYALDAKTGRLVWTFETRDKVNSMACISDGRIYFASRDHNVYCADAKTGRLVWKYQTYDDVASSPIVHEGRVYIGSFDRNFYCMDADNGSLIWKFETQGEVYHPNVPLIAGGKVYFASFDNNLYAVDAGNGRLVWKLKTSEFGCAYSPIMHGNMLYLPTRDGNLLAITPDGKIDWKFSRMHVPSIPAIKSDRIYIGFEDYNLYCLDMKGNVMWKFHTQGSAAWLTVVFWKDLFIFPSWDCNLYAIKEGGTQVAWKFRTEGSPSFLPPANDTFEVAMRIGDQETAEPSGREKRYDFRFDEEDVAGAYKSRITYRVSNQYAARGRYQRNADEEGL